MMMMDGRDHSLPARCSTEGRSRSLLFANSLEEERMWLFDSAMQCVMKEHACGGV